MTDDHPESPTPADGTTSPTGDDAENRDVANRDVANTGDANDGSATDNGAESPGDETPGDATPGDETSGDPAPARSFRQSLQHHRWTVALVAAFVVVRTVVVAVGGDPFRGADSALFLDGKISLTGDAAQFWPVPLLMRLAGSDTTRMWLHHLLATAAWVALAAGVAHTLRRPWVRHSAVTAVLVLGLSPQVVNWDPAMLGESIVSSLAVLVVALWLWRDLASPAVAVGTGVAALLLVGARPTSLPLAAVLVVTAAVGLLRGRGLRVRVATGAVLVLTAGGIGWMVSILDAHDEAYRRRDELGMSFGAELAAGQLWDRMLADDDTFLWLLDRGMPDPVDGIRPAPNDVPAAERAATWPVFLAAATADPDWNQWLDEQGSSLAVEWAAAHPVAALSGWADHSGSVLAGATGDPAGTEAVRGVLAEVHPFFRGSGWTSDIALLFAASALLVLFARRARDTGEVHRADVGAAIAAAGYLTAAAAWLFTGVEYERHAVPGPLVLRIGLLLMAATIIDAMAPRERGARW